MRKIHRQGLSGPGEGLLPIANGGTEASSTKTAAEELHLLTYDTVNNPEGAVGLNQYGTLELCQIPNNLLPTISPINLIGPTTCKLNDTVVISISDFDNFGPTYTCSSNHGTITYSAVDKTLTFTPTVDVAVFQFVFNNHTYQITKI